MIVCPECSSESRVIDSRAHANTIRRRRSCMSCKHKWTTYEVSSNFMSYVSEVPAILSALASSTHHLRTAIDDYDLEAFGEVDKVGRGVTPRSSLPPRCPRCTSTSLTPETDDNYKLPRFRCMSCEYVGTEALFKKKWR